MNDLENHEQLVCTNHDLVYKSEVVPPPRLRYRILFAHRTFWQTDRR